MDSFHLIFFTLGQNLTIIDKFVFFFAPAMILILTKPCPNHTIKAFWCVIDYIIYVVDVTVLVQTQRDNRTKMVLFRSVFKRSFHMKLS